VGTVVPPEFVAADRVADARRLAQIIASGSAKYAEIFAGFAEFATTRKNAASTCHEAIVRGYAEIFASPLNVGLAGETASTKSHFVGSVYRDASKSGMPHQSIRKLVMVVSYFVEAGRDLPTIYYTTGGVRGALGIYDAEHLSAVEIARNSALAAIKSAYAGREDEELVAFWNDVIASLPDCDTEPEPDTEPDTDTE
jgi:hypothetical protein